MKIITGVYTALVTPMKGNSIDYESLEKLLSLQLAGGVDGFVVNGTTGESPCLKDEEVEQLLRFVREKTPKEKKLILGTGSNCTEKTVEDTKKATDRGADAALVVVPYYNKPPQRGLIAHFLRTADSSEIPIILYNVPSRTIAALELETVCTLSEHKNIIGIKEATGNIEFARQIRRSCGDDFCLLSGDDGTYVDFLLAGGDGVISVSSHLFPKAMKQWQSWIQQGQKQKAITDSLLYRNLIDYLFCEANPIPVKKALQMMNILESAELRLPLVELGSPQAEKLQELMKERGIIQ